ncbi:MAG: ATP-binding cassette domain-containing protein [candidate division Zixibacteria bacterium]|nr:ATP-binding cassette domain-containing protein [candidate division Zixibacteria bacterium]
MSRQRVRRSAIQFFQKRAVDHVDFDIRRGDVHALNGGNGSGKSTLNKSVVGLHIFQISDQVSFSSHLQNKTSSKT